ITISSRLLRRNESSTATIPILVCTLSLIAKQKLRFPKYGLIQTPVATWIATGSGNQDTVGIGIGSLSLSALEAVTIGPRLPFTSILDSDPDADADLPRALWASPGSPIMNLTLQIFSE